MLHTYDELCALLTALGDAEQKKNSQLYPNIKIVKELLHICARCRESKCNVKGWIMTLMLEYSILLPHHISPHLC